MLPSFFFFFKPLILSLPLMKTSRTFSLSSPFISISSKERETVHRAAHPKAEQSQMQPAEARTSRIHHKIKTLEATLRNLNHQFYASADMKVLQRIRQVEEKIDSYARCLSEPAYCLEELVARKATHVRVKGKWFAIKCLLETKVEVFKTDQESINGKLAIGSVSYRRIEGIRTLEEFCRQLLENNTEGPRPALTFTLANCIEIEF